MFFYISNNFIYAYCAILLTIIELEPHWILYFLLNLILVYISNNFIYTEFAKIIRLEPSLYIILIVKSYVFLYIKYFYLCWMWGLEPHWTLYCLLNITLFYISNNPIYAECVILLKIMGLEPDWTLYIQNNVVFLYFEENVCNCIRWKNILLKKISKFS